MVNSLLKHHLSSLVFCAQQLRNSASLFFNVDDKNRPLRAAVLKLLDASNIIRFNNLLISSEKLLESDVRSGDSFKIFDKLKWI